MPRGDVRAEQGSRPPPTRWRAPRTALDAGHTRPGRVRDLRPGAHAPQEEIRSQSQRAAAREVRCRSVSANAFQGVAFERLGALRWPRAQEEGVAAATTAPSSSPWGRYHARVAPPIVTHRLTAGHAPVGGGRIRPAPTGRALACRACGRGCPTTRRLASPALNLIAQEFPEFVILEP
jgi:hypothetical protein